MTSQSFGGKWSLIKLDRVEKYLSAFNQVLKNKPFHRIYIDAFAGTGSFEFTEAGMPLFSQDAVVQEHQGSASRAALVQPPFDHLFFIDSDEKLETLQGHLSASALQRSTFLPGDANERVVEVCGSLNRNDRGVIFLDPFGMNVEWPTLQAIQESRVLDLWYLFPLMGVTRQAARNRNQIDNGKARALTRVLGTPAWDEAFYERAPLLSGDLFEAVPAATAKRTISIQGIDHFVRDRLKTVFPYVCDQPLHLSRRGVPLFSLFFAVSNPSHAAQAVAGRIAKAILKQRQ